MARGRRVGVIGKRPLANAAWLEAEGRVGKYVEPYWDRFRAMGFNAESAGASPFDGLDWGEIALRFAAYSEGVQCCITGTATLAHLQENIARVERGPLPPETVRALRDRFRAHDAGWVGQV